MCYKGLKTYRTEAMQLGLQDKIEDAQLNYNFR